jgi:hypothetical protein
MTNGPTLYPNQTITFQAVGLLRFRLCKHNSLPRSNAGSTVFGAYIVRGNYTLVGNQVGAIHSRVLSVPLIHFVRWASALNKGEELGEWSKWSRALALQVPVGNRPY